MTTASTSEAEQLAVVLGGCGIGVEPLDVRQAVLAQVAHQRDCHTGQVVEVADELWAPVAGADNANLDFLHDMPHEFRIPRVLG